MRLSNQLNNRIVLIFAALTVLAILLGSQTFNSYFVILAAVVFILLRLVITLVDRVPDDIDRQLDTDLRRDLINHQLSKPVFENKRIITAPFLQPISRSLAPQPPKEIIAYYN